MVDTASPALLPIQQSTAMSLFAALQQNGGAAFVNPVAPSITTIGAQLATTSTSARLQLAAMDPADSSFPTLRSFQTVLDDGIAQMTALQSHTNSLIFGDTNGTNISGGIAANVGQAMSAMSLQSQMVGAGQSPVGTFSPSNPCAIIGDFFNSIIGGGLALVSQVGQVLQGVLGTVGQLINQINTGITAGLAALQQAVNVATGAIRSAIAGIAGMISSELAAFAQWLGLSNLFNQSSFLSGIFNNACLQPILNAVGNPAMLSVLAQGKIGNARVGVAALGSVW